MDGRSGGGEVINIRIVQGKERGGRHITGGEFTQGGEGR